ncbi:MAG: hypothetical protein HY788_00965 [Deltaproteobacteria bacterium]|nr:hypothetical protein [Deltaproteobacteria bacterium]
MHIRKCFMGRTMAMKAQDRERSCPDEPTGNHHDVPDNRTNAAAFCRIAHDPDNPEKPERTDNNQNTIRRAHAPQRSRIHGELTLHLLLPFKISLDSAGSLCTRLTLPLLPNHVFLSIDDDDLSGLCLLSEVATEKSVAGIA